MYRGKIKGSETFFRLILSDVKMLLLTGKIGKAYKVRTFSVHIRDEIPAIFSTLKPGAQAKTWACLVRFSALKSGRKQSMTRRCLEENYNEKISGLQKLTEKH